MASRFYPQKDIDTFDKFNKELVGDIYSGKDGIIYQPVVIYKVSVYDTEVNMYGESSDGKVYKDGIEVSALVEADDQTTTTDEFGPDFNKNKSQVDKFASVASKKLRNKIAGYVTRLAKSKEEL